MLAQVSYPSSPIFAQDMGDIYFHPPPLHALSFMECFRTHVIILINHLCVWYVLSWMINSDFVAHTL